MTRLTQRDARWGNIPLGFPNTYNPLLIKDYGCTITCLAMIIGTTPDVVNSRLKALPQGQGFQGSLVVWSGIEKAFPGIKVRREYGYNNDDVKANVPNVLVEVPAYPIGGTGSHWVVFIGNFRLNDPWTGLERPTSDFPGATGYTVITGKWEQPIPVPVHIPDAEFRQKVKDIVLAQPTDSTKEKIKALGL